MLSTRKVPPGQKGTKKLHAQYGDRLLCVRYRYDRQQQKRMKTIELIIEESPWTPPRAPISASTIVGIRIAFEEVELQRQVKQAGGKWNRERRLWDICYDQAVALNLTDCIERAAMPNSRNTCLILGIMANTRHERRPSNSCWTSLLQDCQEVKLMRRFWLKKCVLFSVGIVALTAVWVTTIGAERNPIQTGWQQSTSASVRLGVKGKDGTVKAYDALFIVSTLDYPNGRLTHEIKKRVVAGEFTYLYFPEDIHAKALPGKYEWRCEIGDEIVARGEFEYTGEGGQNNGVRILK
jgi:hypothetical protein